MRETLHTFCIHSKIIYFFLNLIETFYIFRPQLPTNTINHIIKNFSYGRLNEKRKLLNQYLNKNEKIKDIENDFNNTKLIDFTEILDLMGTEAHSN